MTKKLLSVLVVACVILCSSTAEARWFRRGRTTSHASVSVSATYSSGQTSTAQGVAELMARHGRVGHFGGNPGYEGCGSGSSPQAAYSICCYGNSGMETVDVGYAQGSNGMWYCCRRYGR